MVNCSYCGVEIKRLVFCKPSHKTLYHRKYPHGISLTLKDLNRAVKEIKPFKQKENVVLVSRDKFSDKKKPGYHFSSMLNKYVPD